MLALRVQAYELGDRVDHGDNAGVEEYYSVHNNGNHAYEDMNFLVETAEGVLNQLMDAVPGLTETTSTRQWGAAEDSTDP